MAEDTNLVIEGLGAQGDGVARAGGNAVYVARGLPGETYEQADGSSFRLVSPPSPLRRSSALCPHFPSCGGCSLQHMSDGLYAGWKQGLIAAALSQHGLEAPIAPMIISPMRSRRRATFGLKRTRAGGVVGFHRPRSNEIEPMTACAVLDPAFEKALPGLRKLASTVLQPGSTGRLTLTKVAGGLDAVHSAPPIGEDPAERAAIVSAAASAGIIRLTIAGETWLQSAKIEVDIAGIRVALPPGAFLQATAEAEAALIRFVADGLGPAKHVADLFSGVGTFALPIARTAKVTAYDSDRNAIAALGAATRNARGLKPISCAVRDLFRTPLTARELEAFDATVLDPPFAGAKAQCEALAASRVPRLAVVSCNPSTLARDLRILVDGGYSIEVITPVDQFLFTHHLEAVAILRRGKRPPRKGRRNA